MRLQHAAAAVGYGRSPRNMRQPVKVAVPQALTAGGWHSRRAVSKLRGEARTRQQARAAPLNTHPPTHPPLSSSPEPAPAPPGPAPAARCAAARCPRRLRRRPGNAWGRAAGQHGASGGARLLPAALPRILHVPPAAAGGAGHVRRAAALSPRSQAGPAPARRQPLQAPNPSPSQPSTPLSFTAGSHPGPAPARSSPRPAPRRRR